MCGGVSSSKFPLRTTSRSQHRGHSVSSRCEVRPFITHAVSPDVSRGEENSPAIRYPKFLAAPNGDVVPYPAGIMAPIEHPVNTVGLASLKIYLPNWAINGDKINKAQEIYTEVYRPRLMSVCHGQWVACSSFGQVVMAPTEKVVLDLARKLFQPKDRSDDYFMACLGSEFTTVADMDDLTMDSVDASGKQQSTDAPGLYFEGEFSVDGGKTYAPYQMKHDTGSSMMGVPTAVLSEKSLNRCRDSAMLRGPDDVSFKANKYEGLFYRVEGLVTKTDVVQLRGDRFLFGQPVFLRYKNVVDKSADTILSMVPLKEETDHEAV